MGLADNSIDKILKYDLESQKKYQVKSNKD